MNDNLPATPVKNRLILTILIFGLLCAAAPGGVLLIAWLVASAIDLPLGEAQRGLSSVLVLAALMTVSIIRLRGFRARGALICDAGPQPRRKLLTCLGLLMILTGVVLLRAASAEAALGAAREQTAQLLEMQRPVVARLQSLVNSQRAILAHKPVDLAKSKRVAALCNQTFAQSNRIGAAIQSSLDQQRRLDGQLIPTELEIGQSLNDFFAISTTIASQPWRVLSSMQTWRLSMALFAMIHGAMTLLIASGRRQIHENGIWQAGLLIRWIHVRACEPIDGDSLAFTIGPNRSELRLPIAPDQIEPVTDLILARLTHAEPAASILEAD